MNPWTKIPAHVRGYLYWAGDVLGTIAGAITVAWAVVVANVPDVKEPVWLLILLALLLFGSSKLSALAGNNLSTPDDGQTVVGELVKDSGPGVGEVLDKVEEVLAEVKARRTPPSPPPAAAQPAPAPVVPTSPAGGSAVAGGTTVTVQTPAAAPAVQAAAPDPVVPGS